MNFFGNGFPIRNSSPLTLRRRPLSLLMRNKRTVPDGVMAKITELHQQGVQGDRNAVNQAYTLLQSVRDLYLRNELVEAYYGSTLALQGRDALEPMERLEKVRSGLTFLDEAVGNDPDQVQIRALRGYVCYRLPEIFFHKTATAVEDFAYLAARYEKEPEVISRDFYRQILADLATAHQNLGHSDAARAIREKLAQLPDVSHD